MRFRFQPWQLAFLLVVLCATAVGLVEWRRISRPFDAAGLLATLPATNATHAYFDVALLRKGGWLDLLAGSKAAEEADYRRFVEQTGFDYRTDLDAVAVSFLHGDIYATLRGRFVWKQLSAYARAQGGECRNAVCNMPASSPNRYISFYPLKSDVLAFAVTSEPLGVYAVAPHPAKADLPAPADPVWLSVPSSMFDDPSSLPAGTHGFLSPLAHAQNVTFSVSPRDQRIEIRLEVTCASPEAASALAQQLTGLTTELTKLIAREHMTPNPRDLSGVLVAGKFEQQEAHVKGTWPIERGFVEALASGQIQ